MVVHTRIITFRPCPESPRIPLNPPNSDRQAKKRFPCRPVRGWTLGALVRAFGEFAPGADSGLRQADGGGGGMCRGCGLRRALMFSDNN